MLTVIRKSGEVFRLADFGIKTINFTVNAPEVRPEYDTPDGADGLIDLGATYGERTMAGEFFMTAADVDDYANLRNQVFRIFASREPFYLIDEREPSKRWLVRAGGFSPNQVRHHGRFSIAFTSPSAFAESVNTTLVNDGVYYGNQIAQIVNFGQSEPEPQYTFSTTTFSVYNAGDVAIDPRRMPLVIKYRGQSTNLEIRNLTTLDTWRYTGTTTAGQSLEINRTRSLKNGVVNVFADTNRKLITLAPGWNEFQLVGTTGSFTIEFNSRFYYL